ncbi:MAG: GAF domain-containing protein [Bacteroidetes bacterium]|nr:GAF domain-containing protein [Bacteroidota bacterium]
MPRFHGYSWLLISIAALLTVVSIVLMSVIPGVVEEREIGGLEKHAESIGTMVASRYGSRLLRGDPVAIHHAEDLMRTIEHLWYFVVVDAQGKVIASVNLIGATRVDFDTDDTSGDSEEEQALKTTLPISLGPEGGTIYIGLSKAEAHQKVRTVRGHLLMIGLILLTLAVGIVVTVLRTSHVEERVSELKKRQKGLQKLKNTLEGEVAEHRLAAETLRESEQRYRYLLENSMESAFKDLEDLNTDLERRKGELEIEVSEKTKAQATLRGYSNRLEALNDISRAMLEGKSLEEIVDHALEHLSEMIEFDRASIIEFDRWIGEGHLIGIRTTGHSEMDTIGFRMPFSFFRSAETTGLKVHYEADISTLEEPAGVEKHLLESGIRSYCRISLSVEDEVVGTLNVGSAKRNAFGEEVIRVARDVADLISIAINQSRHNDERDRYELELISSKNRAEEMARLKSAFLTNMSHEIRTPLSGIIGFAQVLNEEVSEDQKEFTGLIQTSALRLLDTINSVLDLAKLEADQEKVRQTPIDLCKSVRATVRLLRPLADEKGLDLRISAPDEAITCGLELTCIEQIVNNLVGNAIKFTATGYVEVRVEADDERGYLYVEDTGVGISEEFLPKLFDEFRQEEMGSDRRYEGSGLGLAITKRLVEGMSGKIEVASVKDKGTSFTVSFPLFSTRNNLESAEDIGSILIVSPTAQIEPEFWDRHGEIIEVNSAPDLKEALKKARQRRFDLLIVDADNFDPEKQASGLNAIRDIPDYSSVAFIAVATQSLTEFEEHYLRRDFDSFDVDPDGIESFLSNLLARLTRNENSGSRDRKPVSKKVKGAVRKKKTGRAKKV